MSTVSPFKYLMSKMDAIREMNDIECHNLPLSLETRILVAAIEPNNVGIFEGHNLGFCIQCPPITIFFVILFFVSKK